MNSMDTLQELAEFLEKQHTGVTAAGDQEYLQAIKKVLAKENSEPSSEMIRFFVSQVYSGAQTQQVIDRFAPLVKEAFRQFVNDQLVDRLQSVINVQDHGSAEQSGAAKNAVVKHPPRNRSVTNEEFERFFVVNVA